MSGRLVLSRLDWSAFAFVMVIFGGIMGGLAYEGCGGNFFTLTPSDYYGLATDALLSGQTALKLEPRPELKALSNPYAGSLNQPYRAIDLSYFKGRYYFYWGL